MPRVLIVDNGVLSLKRLGVSLENSGFVVQREECLVAGIEAALGQAPDLIITWDRLPGLRASDFLDLRAETADLRAIPVMVVSANSRFKLDCFKRGCDDFVQLPVDDAELSFRACSLLRRNSGSGLSGEFEQIGFVDLVQMLAAARVQGVLRIATEELRAKLFFADGQVVHAKDHLREGEEAFLGVLRAARSKGRFYFDSEDTAAFLPTIHRRTDHILLSFANLLDEEGV